MAKVTGSLEQSPANRHEIRWRAFRLLVSARSSLPLVGANLLLAGLFALMLWGAAPGRPLLLWLGVVATLGVAELVVRGALTTRVTREHGVQRWQKRVGMLDACVGLAWLYAASVFFPASLSSLQFFYLFVLGAVALCTVIYQHYYLPGCFARIGLAMPVAAFHYMSVDSEFRLVQSAIIAGVWVCLIWLAVRLHHALHQRMALTINRDLLLRKVDDNAHDLDALRTAEAASRRIAEQANLAKSRFLAHSSHDLRQPLHAISLLLETVDEDRLDEQTEHVVTRVRQSVEMLATLFDSLLDVTLLDTGQIEIAEVIFDLDKLLAEIANDFASVAAANAVSIEVEPSGQHLHADATIARRMIQNLVANAIRHSPGGKVTLRARGDASSLRIEVEDTGSGIAAHDQQRIFDEFTKLDSPADSHSGAGLGLGLAIVNRLARLTGMEVGLVSEPNQGSLFFIGPFEVCTAVDGPDATRAAPMGDLTDVRVAVVDDDRDTLRATGILLRKWGLDVSLFEDVGAVDMARPNILVCDYELSGPETGIDVIRAIRGQHGDTVPALLISGNTSPELAAEAEREKLPLLHKPVRPVQLKSAILTLLGSMPE